ncbi:MAG TPA: glycogen synthase GlgA [Ramlibacter sp.]|uniref:glycogen synthase GlgA n=1 Tax=Ramlibacter sp. TaxID=1917967 RepID=UPI002D7E8A74|nr:glycogen synthase GlgA [Ramlibacter sp.]HET8744950.1 glycogen synthase GlgA [Ramlibacter sp.]
MKILFATPECAPYVKTGGLGDVSAALPAMLAQLGHDVHLLMPAYRGMKVSGEIGDGVDLPAYSHWPAAQLVPVKVDTGVTLLLLTCPALYQRPGGPYVDASGRDYFDNAMRFGLLARVASQLGTVHSPLRGWRADVVHANDWPCGLAPLYLAQTRMIAPHEPTAASILTIHNLAFQGVFPMGEADALGIPHHWRGIEGVEFWGDLSMLKAGIQFADAITTVSPSYAREIQTEEHGAGFDGILRARASRLRGILNGIDRRLWDPAQDKLLPQRFTREDLKGKAECKSILQQRVHLAVDKSAPLFAVVSRLTAQKGIDIVLDALPALVRAGGQLVVLGQGVPELQEALTAAARQHPKQVAVTLGFDEALAHLIEAGADAFLMPSRFEPCGLNQMYSQAYGTPPIVAPVGGLLDSVTDATADPQRGTGFVMPSCDAAGLQDALGRALAAWKQPQQWRRIQSNGMAREFGWEDSALQYLDVYQAAGVVVDGGKASELAAR